MPDINITVAHKVAVSDTQAIVCDNSDYTVHWTLDDEWSAYDTKTMRTIYMDGTYTDTVFSGDTIELPVCTVPGAVQIGLFAGDIRTSRVAILRALPSVRSAAGAPADPTPDVYDQLMELIKGLGGADPEAIKTAVAEYLAAHPIEETDPTVPAWAKAETKPTYSAEEVGAIAQSDLQAATDAALAQAKASGEFDGAAGPAGQQGPAGTPGKDGAGMDVTGAAVGQIAKIAAVDASGVPTAWSPVDMPSGGGHWETVLDTVWEQDVIHPTDYNSETGIFTCAEGELDNLELDTEYIFFQQCTKEGVAYNTIINDNIVKVTKLSDTTFSIDATPPATFVPTNVKFSKGSCIAVTDIDAKKIRLTLDGQFHPTATLYDRPFYKIEPPYFCHNTGYAQIRNAYQAYQQVTAEVESPYRIVGEILCGFNAPSQNAIFHFKNNSFCCPLIPYDVPKGNERNILLTSDGTKIAKLYSTGSPWLLGTVSENTAIVSDYLEIISGTKVKLERWVE